MGIVVQRIMWAPYARTETRPEKTLQLPEYPNNLFLNATTGHTDAEPAKVEWERVTRQWDQSMAA